MDSLLVLPAGMAVVAGGILFLRLHPFLALIAGALAVGWLSDPAELMAWGEKEGMDPGELRELAEAPVISRVAEGFGHYCGRFGILIAMAAIIGVCLLESGGAERIVRSLSGLLGERRAPSAFAGSGFLLGIPVFFDTVFYLMVPLARAMAVRDPSRNLLFVLAVSAGATMSHSLIPPTPGPLAVAGLLDLPLAALMAGGLAVGLAASFAGLCFAHWANRRWPLPLRALEPEALERLRAHAARPVSGLPPLGLSLLPIVLPVGLIAAAALLEAFAGEGGGAWRSALGWAGEKNMALILGALAALSLLALSRREGGPELAPRISSALASAGVIVFITAAGGAFGKLLEQSGISLRLSELAEGAALWILPLAFAATALVRTAQGSATVAMVTAAGIFSGLATEGGLDFHPVYLGLAIGCGSKPFSWMNDSGFWVVSRMTGMTEREMLRSHSLMLAVMGLAGLAVVMAAAWILPMSPGAE